MQQIKQSIVVLLLLGVVIGVYAASPWPPPPIVPPETVEDKLPPLRPVPKQTGPRVVDRPATVPAAPVPVRPGYAVLPGNNQTAPAQTVPNRSMPNPSGPAIPYPLVATPSSHVLVEVGLPAVPPTPTIPMPDVATPPPQPLNPPNVPPLPIPNIPNVTPIQEIPPAAPTLPSPSQYSPPVQVNDSPVLPPPVPPAIVAPKIQVPEVPKHELPVPPPAIPKPVSEPTPLPLPLPGPSKATPLPLEPKIEGPAPAIRMTPSTIYEANPLPSMPTNPAPQAPAPVYVPDNQPKAFRLIKKPQQSYDPPMSQGTGTPPPSGTLLASSPLTPVYTPPPVQQYQSPPPAMYQQPVLKTPLLQSPPSNNTPVTMEMNGPNDIKPGAKVTFEIVLRNPASLPAKDVQIEAEVKGARLELASMPQPTLKNGKMTWKFPVFPAHSEKRFKVVMRALTADCMATYMIWGPPVAEAGLPERSPPMAHVPVAPNSNQGLLVTVNGPSNANLNQPVVFDIRIVNTGSHPIIRPILRVSLPGGLKHPMGNAIDGEMDTLPPGGEKTIQVTTTAAQPGRHSLHCTVTAANARQASATASITLGQQGLQVQQQPTYKLLTGQNNEIRFQVINNTSETLRQVSVSDMLPDGVEFLYAGDNGIFHSGSRDVNWLLELAPNQVKTLSVQIQPQRDGEWSHEVLARCATAPEVSSTAVLRAEITSNLHVKVIGSSRAEVGKTIIYRIAVTNQGSSPLTNVKVHAILSDGLTPNHGQGPTAYRSQGRQITFTPLGQLNPQAREEFFVGAIAQSTGDRGVNVQVSCDQNAQLVSREERTLVTRD